MKNVVRSWRLLSRTETIWSAKLQNQKHPTLKTRVRRPNNRISSELLIRCITLRTVDGLPPKQAGRDADERVHSVPDESHNGIWSRSISRRLKTIASLGRRKRNVFTPGCVWLRYENRTLNGGRLWLCFHSLTGSARFNFPSAVPTRARVEFTKIQLSHPARNEFVKAILHSKRLYTLHGLRNSPRGMYAE